MIGKRNFDFTLTIVLSAILGFVAFTPSLGQTTQQATLIVKIGTAGVVSVDGKDPSNVSAGKVLSLSLQPGQHLVSLKVANGKTIEKIVNIESGHSSVILLGGSQTGLATPKATPPSNSAPSDTGAKGPSNSESPHNRVAANAKGKATQRDDLEMERANARVTALDILGLFTAAIDEAKRLNVQDDTPTLFLQVTKQVYDEMAAKGQHQVIHTLVALGKIDEAMKNLRAQVATSRKAAPDEMLAQEGIQRAIAYYAAGEQQQGVFEISQVPRYLSFLEPVESKSTLDMDLEEYEKKGAALKALTGDWRGCAQLLSNLQQRASEMDPNSEALNRGCRLLTEKQTISSALDSVSGRAAEPLLENNLRATLRVRAFEALNLWADALEAETKLKLPSAQLDMDARFVRNSSDMAEKHTAAGVKVSGGTVAEDLLGAGKPEQALLYAEQGIRDADNAISKVEAIKGKCAECGGKDWTFDSALGNAHLARAEVLAEMGQLSSGLAEVREAQRFLFLAKTEGNGESDFIAKSFVDLAAISALAGDGEGCGRALKELPDSNTLSPKKYGGDWDATSLWAGCSWLAFQSASGQAGEQPEARAGSTVEDQINEVVRSGKYSALPEPQVISKANGNGSPIIQFKNSTAYNLTVLCAGPSERSIQVGPGQSFSIKLEAGNYRMMGRVEAPNVLPLYKEFRFENATYSINFYLTPR